MLFVQLDFRAMVPVLSLVRVTILCGSGMPRKAQNWRDWTDTPTLFDRLHFRAMDPALSLVPVTRLCGYGMPRQAQSWRDWTVTQTGFVRLHFPAMALALSLVRMTILSGYGMWSLAFLGNSQVMEVGSYHYLIINASCGFHEKLYKSWIHLAIYWTFHQSHLPRWTSLIRG